MESIVNRMISYIRDNKIKQKDICDTINVSSSTFSTWVSRGSDFPASYVAGIAKAMGVRTDWLLTGEGTPEAPPEPEAPPLVIPEGYRLVTPEEEHLLDLYESLDWNGQTVVKNKAVEEYRRLKGNTPGNASTRSDRSEETLGA